MPVAVRKPQPSSPVDGILISYEDSIEDLLFSVASETPVNFELELGVEDVQFSVGPAVPIGIDHEIGFSDHLFHFKLSQMAFFDELSLDLFQNFAEQLLPEELESADPGDTVQRLDNLELDLALSTTFQGYFKEYNYSSGLLLGFSLYSSAAKSNVLYNVSFNYVADTLVSKLITRVSDNAQLLVSFNYDVDGTLLSQNRSIM